MAMTKTESIGAIALSIGLLGGAASAALGLHPHAFAESIENYLLPLFFVLVGVELRHEFSHGYFRERKNIVGPTVAAILGVVAPAVLFTSIAGSNGWAVPTATDITVGLVILAIFGSKLGLRARFLALATIDDLIGLAIILALFTANVNLVGVLVCLLSIVALGFTQKLSTKWSRYFLLFGPLAVFAGANSGLQTSVIGFLLGTVIADAALIKVLPGINNYVVLPLFGFSVMADALSFPLVAFSPIVFIAVCARPIGKFIGIFIGGVLGDAITRTRSQYRDWAGIGILGGIGLTVSFLLAQLSFDSQGLRMSAVLGTLAATAASTVLFALFTSYRARQASK